MKILAELTSLSDHTKRYGLKLPLSILRAWSTYKLCPALHNNAYIQGIQERNRQASTFIITDGIVYFDSQALYAIVDVTAAIIPQSLLIYAVKY